MVIEKLSSNERDKTFASLAALMNREASESAKSRKELLDNTLIRRLETNLFDANSIHQQKRALIKSATSNPIRFSIRKNHLPEKNTS
jgi:hypothetical protein